MATPEVVAEKRELAGINADYKEKFGFHDPETGYAYKAPKGLSAARSSNRSPSTRKSRSGCGTSGSRRSSTSNSARPRNGAATSARSTSTTSTTSCAPRSRTARDWSEVPEDIKNTFDRLGIPEAERKFLSGVGAQYESEVVYHQVNEKLEAQGVIFTDMDTALREHEDLAARVLGDDDPAQRQQTGGAQLRRLVGRLVRLRPRRGQGRDAAAGLLPDQHREHGPVRADADHRRGGRRRPLHRGLHGAGLLERLAALRGGRDRRQTERAGPLHDRPELVAERLQPRHQARRRAREGDDGVGRLQPRLETDDEVPVDLPDGRAKPTARSSRSPSPAPASTRTRAARSSTPRRAPRPRSSPSRSPRTAAGRPTAA